MRLIKIRCGSDRVAVLALLHLLLLAGGCDGRAAPDLRSPGANILLVTLDTTRADYIGAYGGSVASTPVLDRLAAEGTLFSQAATSAPLTRPAHSSLLTGRYPTRHGVRDNGAFFLAEDEQTLAETLRDRGYRTGAIIGAFVLHHVWGLDQGFEEYDDRFDEATRRADPDLHVQRIASEVVAKAVAWLRNGDERPFFLWTHFYDPHFPYEAPAGFAGRHPGNPYAEEIEYMDAMLGRLIEQMKSAGIYDSTLVVVVGDHGEALGEHQEVDHGIFLYEPTMRVPLIIRAPGGGRGSVIDRLVRDIDVMATVLDLLGVPAPPSSDGRSMLPLMAGTGQSEERYAYGESWYARLHYGWSELHSMRDRRYKYIEAPAPELYDLVEDPGELRNVIENHPGVAEELRTLLLRELSAEDREDRDSPAAELDPDTLQRLRALGYVGSTLPESGEALPDPKSRADSLKLFARVGYRASKALREERPEDAIALVREALDLEPNYLDGYLLLAEAYVRLQDPAKAAEAARAGLAISPEDVNLLLRLAKAHIAGEEYDSALDLLSKIEALAPEMAALYHSKRDVLSAQGRYRAALDVMKELLRIHPDEALAWYEAGRLQFRLGEPAEARRLIEESLRLLPGLRGAHYNLALVAESMGEPQEAERQYRLELDTYPENHEAWTNLGILMMQLGRPREAEHAFRTVIDLRPSLYVGYFLLARLYLESVGPNDEALRLALKADELESSPATAELVRAIRSLRD